MAGTEARCAPTSPARSTSPVILPIPGTSSPEHLEENWDARRIALSPDEMAAIGKQD